PALPVEALPIEIIVHSLLLISLPVKKSLATKQLHNGQSQHVKDTGMSASRIACTRWGIFANQP
ncbi:MAG TPA: hypothetical protein VFL97_00655, partial [Nitrococcus sp.]|nr:hypothetical protein [Nitrococcus sp.]